MEMKEYHLEERSIPLSGHLEGLVAAQRGNLGFVVPILLNLWML
jgi:hypothetical protein